MLSPTSGGFGLTSLKERARLAEGELEVRSAPGMGTQVEARIPYRTGPQDAPSRMESSSTADLPRKVNSDVIRVLIADDHELVRQGIRNMLERSAALIIAGEAEDGEDAVGKIRTIAPDVALIDIRMPKLDGVETVRRLRDLGVDTPVILLSAYAKEEYIFEGLRAGGPEATCSRRREKTSSRMRFGRCTRAARSCSPQSQADCLIGLSGNGGPGLTDRELEVLRLMGTGARDKEIAHRLRLSTRTVRFHAGNVYQKLDAQSRTQAVRIAAERGLLDI